MTKTDALRSAILSLEGPVFAVLDGAQFPDLPDTLLRSNVGHQCLYLDRGDNHPERLKTAPYLVEVTDNDARSAVLEMLERVGPSAAVFWQCAAGGQAFYRHLRGINMVEIPRGIDDELGEEEQATEEALHDLAGAESPAAVSTDDHFETVLFRHADANVMAQIAQSVYGSALARLLGPARSLVFQPDEVWHGNGPMTIRSEGTSTAAGGLLRLDTPALDRIGEVQMDASRGRIAGYLEDVAAEEFGAMTPEDRRRFILGAERSGLRHGFESEHAHGLWVFLLLIMGGALLSSPAVSNHLSSTNQHPDEALEALMDEIAEMDEDEMAAYAP